MDLEKIAQQLVESLFARNLESIESEIKSHLTEADELERRRTARLEEAERLTGEKQRLVEEYTPVVEEKLTDLVEKVGGRLSADVAKIIGTEPPAAPDDVQKPQGRGHTSADNMDRRGRLILEVLSEGAVDSVGALFEQITAKGYTGTRGALYSVLNKLEVGGYLKREKTGEGSRSPIRVEITDGGKDYLGLDSGDGGDGADDISEYRGYVLKGGRVEPGEIGDVKYNRLAEEGVLLKVGEFGVFTRYVIELERRKLSGEAREAFENAYSEGMAKEAKRLIDEAIGLLEMDASYTGENVSGTCEMAIAPMRNAAEILKQIPSEQNIEVTGILEEKIGYFERGVYSEKRLDPDTLRTYANMIAQLLEERKSDISSKYVGFRELIGLLSDRELRDMVRKLAIEHVEYNSYQESDVIKLWGSLGDSEIAIVTNAEKGGEDAEIYNLNKGCYSTILHNVKGGILTLSPTSS
jgi:DNA-binding PadR family transcriptional regulator